MLKSRWTGPQSSPLDYTIGSIVKYRAFCGTIRETVVIESHTEIKEGCPGFDGYLKNDPGMTVWGYNQQIIEVVKF